MFDFKLQIGCLIIVLYFIVSFVHDGLKNNLPCSKLFDAMLFVVPWAIVFDGITAYTVNRMDILPDAVNRGAHLIFFLIMAALTIMIFLYMYNQILGITGTKQAILLSLPGILSIIIILVFFDKVYFVEGISTNYSMGISVYAAFISLFLHYIAILVIILRYHRAIEKTKMFGLVAFMLITFVVLIVQVILPEVLISSLVPTLMVLGLYANFEDPSLRKIHTYNSDVVAGFATLVESRDSSTGDHVQRSREYVRIILDAMKKNRIYPGMLTKDYISGVIDAAPLHDIGKIGISDEILHKPGKLTSEEYEIMKTHSQIGSDILEKILNKLDDKEYMTIASEEARYHHEKWNGRGYPVGLCGEDIPLHARIMAIADVFDAVSEKRCYREAMSLDRAFAIIEEGAGSDFDPVLAKLFLESRDRIEKFHNEHK